MANIKEAVDIGVTRLNTKEPQYPPDIYYIRRNERYLRTYLTDKSKIQRMLSKATPDCQQRFELFKLKEEDL